MAISISKPTVGGSEDTWGTTINASLDTIVDGVNGDAGTIAPNLSTLTINGTDVTATAAELNYMDGVTSNVQTQLDAKGDISGVTAGSGLSGGGSSGSVTVSHADTSSQGSVNNSGNTVIQDITLDTYGHVTGINSATISPPTTAGAVGTYALLHRTSGSSSIAVGGTYSGSGLRYLSFQCLFTSVIALQTTTSRDTQAISGTWRAMSHAGTSINSDWAPAALFVRIS